MFLCAHRSCARDRILANTQLERKEGAELGDEFNIDVDDAMEDRPERGGGSRGRGGKTKVSLYICILSTAIMRLTMVDATFST